MLDKANGDCASSAKYDEIGVAAASNKVQWLTLPTVDVETKLEWLLRRIMWQFAWLRTYERTAKRETRLNRMTS